jgi:hypothetical protein
MSFVSIRCPNCAATESIPVGENKYQCRYCDNTFNYVDPNAPKITKNVTIQEIQRYNCPICGRGVTAGTSHLCMSCGKNDFCDNCSFETSEKRLICKNCLTTTSYDCQKCGIYSAFRCISCIKLHDKDESHTITRYCSEHFVDRFVMRQNVIGDHMNSYFICANCRGLVCNNCRKGRFFPKCKYCGNKLIRAQPLDSGLKKKRISLADDIQRILTICKSSHLEIIIF